MPHLFLIFSWIFQNFNLYHLIEKIKDFNLSFNFLILIFFYHYFYLINFFKAFINYLKKDYLFENL